MQNVHKHFVSSFMFVYHSTTGIILMSLKSPAERTRATELLAPCVVDPENVSNHLLPFLACDNHSVRRQIIKTVLGCS